MYGMIPRPRGIFGRSPQRPPWATPDDERMGLPAAPEFPQMTPAQAPEQGGFLAPGGAGKVIAGTIGDVLLQHNDMAPIYAPTMQLQQRAQAEEEMRQRERMEGREDKAWEWANKPPPTPNNDTVADYEFIMRTLGPEKAQEYLESKANPPQYRVGPDGQFYRVDVAAPPKAPVGRLTPLEETSGSNAAPGFPR